MTDFRIHGSQFIFSDWTSNIGPVQLNMHFVALKKKNSYFNKQLSHTLETLSQSYKGIP